MSSEEFSKIRNILSQNNIKYSDKVINRNSASVTDTERSQIGTFGQNLNYSYTYYIYVHKDDYETCIGLINKK